MRSCLTRSDLCAVSVAFFTASSPLGAAEQKALRPDQNSMEQVKARANEVMKVELTGRHREEVGACESRQKIDPFEIWKGVGGPEDAGRLLREHYRSIRSVEAMADWLRCQGFHVSISRGPVQQNNSQVRVRAGFIPSEHKGRPLWRGWLPWQIYHAQNFTLFFDKSDQIIQIGIAYTYE
jgi:hypothetical protein